MRCNVETAPKGLDLRDRVIWVINDFVGTWRKYPYLEERTGIPARKWQNVCHRKQQPSVEMISALADYRPHLLTWMILGHELNSQQFNPELPEWEEALSQYQLGRVGASLPDAKAPRVTRKNKGS